MTTHVLMVIDMSGSMARLADDVRGGYNSYIENLKADEFDYRVTVTNFDTEFIPICRNVPLDRVPLFDRDNYMPRGSTALLAAVGKTITEFETEVKPGDDDKIVLVVNTDGQENMSQIIDDGKWTSDLVGEMLKGREALGWTIIYMGAGQEAWSQGLKLGLSSRSVYETHATRGGTRSSYSAAYAGTYGTASGLDSYTINTNTQTELDKNTDK